MDMIRSFAEHKVAANMLMLIMVMFGLWGVRQINLQLNPSQHYNNVLLEAYWPGASAEDMERQITQPLEHHLRSVKDLREMKSSISEGALHIDLEFEDHIDSDEALDEVKQAASQARFLPRDMEPLVIKPFVPYERLADLLVIGDHLKPLIPLALEFERELLALGIDKIEFLSLPEMEMAIQVDRQKLLDIGISLDQLGETIAATSRDFPAGNVGAGDNEMQLRSLDQQRTPEGFRDLVVRLESGRLLRLGDIATVAELPRDDAVLTSQDGRPAIWMRILRAPGSDTLASAEMLQNWLAQKQGELPENIEIQPLLETWKFTEQQFQLVIENGISGLILVLLTLYFFLNGRIAFWVALGIPVSFAFAITLFYYGGGSINALSLIGLIMALGIVVDDAIVVSEENQSRLSAGLPPTQAAYSAAQSMLSPVLASSLTTMAALIPIMLVDGGALREIPLLMLCIISASLVECFLVLPGHLRSTDPGHQPNFMTRFREGMRARGERFRQEIFIPLIRQVLRYRVATLCFAGMAFLVALSLLVSGRVKTEMAVGFSQDFIEASVKVPGAGSVGDRQAAVGLLQDSLARAEKELGGALVSTHILSEGAATLDGERKRGNQYLTLFVEMVSADERQVTVEQLTNAWRGQLSADRPKSIESFDFHVGQDLNADLSLYFTGSDVQQLKNAAEELKQALRGYQGVHSVMDDLPYGEYQSIFKLNAEGRAMGLTAESLARQVYAAYEGVNIQMFNRLGQEVDVVVKLPKDERENVFRLKEFPIRAVDGRTVPLGSIAEVTQQRGIQVIQHYNGELAVNITANVDNQVNTPMAVLASLEDTAIPQIAQKYQLKYGLSENSAAEQRIIGDMLWGMCGALVLIYLILCWNTASYVWPLAIMVAIPLALTGAFVGLYVADMNLGVLSTLGLFTLAGVVVNDAIIVINDYKTQRKNGLNCHDAIEHAACSRFRAVLLTSITTTVGLMPLIFEDSLMGRFMAPLAVVICCGMIYGTILILLVLPAALSWLDSIADKAGRKGAPVADAAWPAAEPQVASTTQSRDSF